MGQRADEVSYGGGLGDNDPDRDIIITRETEVVSVGTGEEETQEIRAEIEQTRASLSETIDALTERLSPDHLKEQMKEQVSEQVQEAKEAVREATIGRAEDMVRSATDTVNEARYTVMDTIRQNPIPAALTGIGLSWLYMNRGGTSSRPQPRYQGYASYGAGQPRYQGYGSYDMGQPRYQEQSTVGEAFDRAKETAGNVASQVQDTAGQFVDRAQHQAQRLEDRLPRMVRENPIPAALVGLGLGWLYMNRGSTSSGSQGRYQSQGRYYGSQPQYQYRGSSQASYQGQGGGTLDRARDTVGNVASQARDTAGSVASQTLDTAGNVASQARDTVGNVASQTLDTAGNVASQVQDTAGQLVDQAQYQAQRLEDRFQQMLYERPLAVGAIAVALGTAVGLAVPATRQEQQLMGEARDNLMERAQDVAQDTMQKVQRVASEVTEEASSTARDAAQREGLSQQ